MVCAWRERRRDAACLKNASPPLNVAGTEIRSLRSRRDYLVGVVQPRLLGFRRNCRKMLRRGACLDAGYDVQARGARAGVVGYGVSVEAADGSFADDFEFVCRGDRTVGGRQ